MNFVSINVKSNFINGVLIFLQLRIDYEGLILFYISLEQIFFIPYTEARSVSFFKLLLTFQKNGQKNDSCGHPIVTCFHELVLPFNLTLLNRFAHVS